MTISQLVEMARKRLVHLTQLRAAAESLGDVTAEATFAAEIGDTELTLASLLTLLP
jgi:hypothetical protein